MSNHKLTVANLCVKSNSLWTNFADNGNKCLRMYNVCTMYTTAVGVISPRQLACCLHRNKYDIWCNVCWETFCSLRSHGTRDKAGSILDKGYRERVSVETFCSLRSHGTRFAYGRLRAQALSQPCLVKGRWWRVVSDVNKLTTANLCDRKKRRGLRERYYDSSMSLRNSRFVLRRLYFVSPITPCPVW